MIFFIDEVANLQVEHTVTKALASECVVSPHGFTVTAFAFEEFLTHNALHYRLHSLMHSLDEVHYTNLDDISNQAQLLLKGGALPPGLCMAITSAYKRLGINEPVIVSPHIISPAKDIQKVGIMDHQSSEPTACGEVQVLPAVKHCFAALYTAEAIRFRQEQKLVHDKAVLCVTVQKMARLPQSTQMADVVSLNGTHVN